MKKGKHYRKNTKRLSLHKGLLLAAVSLLLVGMTAVTTTISWIEDVSQVEFNTNDNSQQTPVHIGKKILKSDAVMKSNPTGTTEVNLEDYFNKSGDMHLSPCYGDGENFYFPIVTATNGGFGFRTGTKDDANVNYLSATFRLKSEGANTAYWFEKTGNTPYITFKDGGAEGNPVSDLEQYLRCSITVDGATTVYALNNNGKFNTVNGTTVTPVNGKRMDEYAYYQEPFDDNTKLSELDYSLSSKYVNQGGGSNLNGNTLFNVNQYASTNRNTVKTVTVKIWLEYSIATGTNLADIASVNMNLVSSWAKMRRIFVYDCTVDEYDASITNTGSTWLGNSNAKLFWAVKNDEESTGYSHFEAMTSIGNGKYYIDIPATYNNVATTLFRCQESWNAGNSHEINDKTINYWDKWDTTFPDTFHSEVYSVYSHKYATWDQNEAKSVVFVDSVKLVDHNLTPKVYLWDSNSVYGDEVNDKVVRNADWPGLEMTRLYATAGNMNLPTYQLFFGSVYDRAVFNDGLTGARNQLQTQDLYLVNGNENWFGKYFDMATLGWYNSKNDLPNYTDCVLVNNFNTNGSTQSHIRMVWYNNGTQGTNNQYFMCKAFIKSPGSYFFKIWDSNANTHYGRPTGWSNWGENYGATARDIGDSNNQDDLIYINITEQDIADSENGVFRFFYNNSTHYFKWERGEFQRN